jgi:hypothetical protein
MTSRPLNSTISRRSATKFMASSAALCPTYLSVDSASASENIPASVIYHGDDQ